MIGDPMTANDGDGRDGDASDPGDFVLASEATTDCAGIVQRVARDRAWPASSARTPTTAIWTAGIDWAARILPVRVLGKCGGYDSDIVDGIAWAAGLDVPGMPANPTPAQVINMSLGGAALARRSIAGVRRCRVRARRDARDRRRRRQRGAGRRERFTGKLPRRRSRRGDRRSPATSPPIATSARASHCRRPAARPSRSNSAASSRCPTPAGRRRRTTRSRTSAARASRRRWCRRPFSLMLAVAPRAHAQPGAFDPDEHCQAVSLAGSDCSTDALRCRDRRYGCRRARGRGDDGRGHPRITKGCGGARLRAPSPAGASTSRTRTT